MNNKNKNSGVKPTKVQTIKNNVIESRDLVYLIIIFINYSCVRIIRRILCRHINGTSLNSGSQKLFERNEIPSLNSLILEEAKAIKYKKYYHIALPINEGQRKTNDNLKSNHCSNKKFVKRC